MIQLDGEKEQPVCPSCSITHCATTPEVYALAKEYMADHSFGYYSQHGRHDYRDFTELEKANTGKMCEIIGWLLTRPMFEEGGDESE